MRTQRLRNPRIAIAGKIREPRFVAELVEIDGLRAPWGLAGPRQAATPGERVNGARLADVRAPGERDFGRTRRRQVGRPADGAQELGLGEGVHGCPWKGEF